MSEIVITAIAVYLIGDMLVYVIVKDAVLNYWRKKDKTGLHTYSFVPLVNIPLLIYCKQKYGNFLGIEKEK